MQNKRVLFLISLGAILEYYDFAIFIYLAPFIGQALIPVQNPTLNLILSFTIFAIGAFFRPVGGIIFGHIGDTRGRNKTFIYTILFMAIPTLCIAFIPNADRIGVWATIGLVIFRIFQGLAIGGEVPGSIVFGYEMSTKAHRALGSAIVVLGTNIGFVLASIICIFIANLHSAHFQSWRLAFVLGGIFGIISYFLRKNLSETPAFIDYKRMLTKETVPFKLLLANHSKSIWQLTAIGCFLSSSLAIFTFYMPIYLSTFYHFPLKQVMEFNSYTIVIFICGALVAGFWDKCFGKKFHLGFILVFSIAVWLLFKAYPRLNLDQIFFLHILFLAALGIICGRLPVLSAAFFPVAVRYSGAVLIYNISFGIIAGSTQMILTWLIKITGLLWVPALYLAVFSFFAFIAVLSIKAERLVDYPD